MTFGFQSAMNIAVEVIDSIHSTAFSHSRVFIVEIMGHKAGWLTLHAGIASGADVIVIPEIPYDARAIAAAIQQRAREGKRFSIVAVAEGAISREEAAMSKKDFKAYIEESKALGVNIIPEIDTPAHSLALTKVRPDLRHGTSGRQNDHLDIAKQYDECFKFVRGIFDEYVKGGDAAVFAGADTIHVGADEYTADGNAYRKFVNDMFKYSEDNGKKARVWGSLSTIKGDVEVKGVSEDGKHHREMNLWNPGWADLKKMYELGFDLIDCQDGVFYIVPNAGYYYDYLGDAAYTDQLNSISGVAIPAGDPQMVGGAYAVWNDMCDYLENGVSEYDIYDRIDHSLGLFAANSWGKGKLDTAGAKAVVSKLGDSPNVDFGYEVSADKNGVVAHWAMDSLKDASELGRDLVAGKNAAIEDVDGKKALKLNGGESFASVNHDRWPGQRPSREGEAHQCLRGSAGPVRIRLRFDHGRSGGHR